MTPLEHPLLNECPGLASRPSGGYLDGTLTRWRRKPSPGTRQIARPDPFRDPFRLSSRLGVMPELIEPGKPQQNGRHERMHRTLKAEATRPPAARLGTQQRKFNRFREEFNHERPHEALDQETPASVYEPSRRKMPNKLPPLEYPDRFELRYVSANGGIRWNKGWINVSIVCAGENVGLEEIDDGIWNVYFGPLKLGRLHERHIRIEDEYGRLKRK